MAGQRGGNGEENKNLVHWSAKFSQFIVFGYWWVNNPNTTPKSMSNSIITWLWIQWSFSYGTITFGEKRLHRTVFCWKFGTWVTSTAAKSLRSCVLLAGGDSATTTVKQKIFAFLVSALKNSHCLEKCLCSAIEHTKLKSWLQGVMFASCRPGSCFEANDAKWCTSDIFEIQVQMRFLIGQFLVNGCIISVELCVWAVTATVPSISPAFHGSS